MDFSILLFFFFNPPPTTKIYTLSLHDALPIYYLLESLQNPRHPQHEELLGWLDREDRKSTRLNSSHVAISYAVFCLKKKKKKNKNATQRTTHSNTHTYQAHGQPGTYTAADNRT